MSQRWQDAAFEQEHLLHALDGYFGDLCDGYQQSAFGAYGEEEEPSSRVVRVLHREMLQRADPVYVARNPALLWESAREQFEPEPIHATDLVVPCGFALLPWATTIRGDNGQPVAFKAIAWMPVSDDDRIEWSDDIPGIGVWVSLLSMGEEGDDRPIVQRARQEGWRWSLMHGTLITFGTRPWENFDDPADNQTVRDVHRYVASFWRLMSQLVPVRTPLHRQARKQRRRRGMVEDVTVIHLRRHRDGYEGPETEATVDWQFQWVVRGHWRKQPYGPRENPSYRQIWISPYVKGPEDKPLKITRRAFEFDR